MIELLVIFRFMDYTFNLIFVSISLLYVLVFFYYRFTLVKEDDFLIKLFNKGILKYYVLSIIWLIAKWSI